MTAFYFVKLGENRGAITSAKGITFARLLVWNPLVGSECRSLWADVLSLRLRHWRGRLGPNTPAGNGETTPAPARADMVTYKLHQVPLRPDRAGVRHRLRPSILFPTC